MAEVSGLGPTRRRLENDINGDGPAMQPGTVRSMRGLADEQDDLRDGVYRRIELLDREQSARFDKLEGRFDHRGAFGLSTTVQVLIGFGMVAAGGVVGLIVGLIAP